MTGNSSRSTSRLRSEVWTGNKTDKNYNLPPSRLLAERSSQPDSQGSEDRGRSEIPRRQDANLSVGHEAFSHFHSFRAPVSTHTGNHPADVPPRPSLSILSTHTGRPAWQSIRPAG
jgi:hypothetical protein